MSDNESKNESNGIVIVLSILIPIVGYILFFMKKDEMPDVAKQYLWAAIGGSFVGIILML